MSIKLLIFIIGKLRAQLDNFRKNAPPKPNLKTGGSSKLSSEKGAKELKDKLMHELNERMHDKVSYSSYTLFFGKAVVVLIFLVLAWRFLVPPALKQKLGASTERREEPLLLGGYASGVKKRRF